ncbi:DHH family phosphoesterase [Wansuia hejianensis]|uniref:Cyclic-di-AMP phosphodiesterase n=1 Tax=Wansuia hejianensis TaxID=2763667 RepID=A0A926IH83_9FIRM|nr:DHH family phosphoesterase [Wansuia hejianensis]MBC8590382.1 DHH family phosphoesterase [Wansuia hejianensis]
MNNKLFHWSDAKVYLAIIAIMVAIIGFYQPIIGTICGLAFAYLIYYAYIEANTRNEELKKYIETLSDKFESATKHAIFNMPFPLVLIDSNGIITWYNTPFLDMIVEEDILNESIYDLVPNFKPEKVLNAKENEAIPIEYDNRDYLVYPNFIDNKKISGSENRVTMLYWVNNSDYVKLEKQYIDEKTTVAIVYVDNYDEVKSSTTDINRPLLLAEIDKRITEYFTNYNGIVRKFENDKYIIVFNNKSLEIIQDKRFDILDDLRELDKGNKIPITLSMGISTSEKGLLKSFEDARAAIDIALGRGGDQAVLNKNGNLEFYGGKSKALEKRNKVRSRVIGYALKQLIDQTETIFVMGHKNPDMDSFGSGIGILRGIENRNKKGYLVISGENPSIKNLYDRLREEQPELLEHLITPEEAKEIIDENSLMILVDNHKPSFTEEPELLNIVDKVVVIDHHRRGAEFVENPVLIYVEPYASSTSELVTEILSYMSENNNLTKFEAEALLAGITVDTKNFSFQTGVRTFEAASILKRAGADTTSVRQLFRDDYNTFIDRAEVIRSAQIISDRIAIGRLGKEVENGILIAAQAADELLDINHVEASFVLTYSNDRIHISGRSLGTISVQLILEALGGGGHLTSAGAQISGVPLEKAEEMLIEAIDKYFEEGES